ncbi:hypothetical protein ABZ192_36500 [Streptomyces sp. NPDC006235]|uniref:hypothetical protein n=1 Tax=Streptomyces sp. NPDC006235 TaxID=3156736 RepID=UPI0033A2D8ED
MSRAPLVTDLRLSAEPRPTSITVTATSDGYHRYHFTHITTATATAYIDRT